MSIRFLKFCKLISNLILGHGQIMAIFKTRNWESANGNWE